jgi:uncharacterized repeat protein (TIGR01451 family)
MKRLSTLLLYLVLVVAAHAQSVSLTLTTAPCHDDGVLTANVTGLTPPLTVSWHTSGYGATTITHTGVSALTDALTSYSGGPIYVSVTDGTSTASGSYAGMPPFTYSISTTSAVCPALGTATATVTGGTSPYIYSWFNSASMSTVGTSNPISVPSGNYGVTITDAAGCTYGSMSVYDSGLVYVTPSYSVSTTTTTANCTNGTAAVTAPGAVPPLGYLWSAGATTSSISGLSMGSYSVMVTDATGCVASAYAYVSQAITITVPTTPTPATCLASDGAVMAFGSGGIPPYTYLWSNGATTASQTGLPAGYYGVTVHDANGCIGNGNANVIASTPITVTYSSTASSCTSASGTATIVAAGGTPPYSYLWYSYPVQTTATATNLAPGNYDFKVTDAMGCIRTGTVIVNPIHIITASFTSTSATCTLPNGSLHVTPSGGTTPYTYSWAGSSSTTASLTAATGGYHYVTITDAAGCAVTKYGIIPITSPMSLSVGSTPASCIFNNDGGATAIASGGTTPYTYHWTSGGSTSSISGVAHGNYWIYVSDAIGCTANQYVSIGYNASNTSCYCTVQGTVYHDANNNCTQDPGEAGIPNIQMNCGGHYTYTNASGHYSFMVPSGTYTVTETVLAFYPLSSCQSNSIVVTAAAATGCTIPVNFANVINPIHDVHISTWDYTPAIPGNTYNQITVVSNDGTVAESAPIGGYKTDGQLFTPTFAPGGVFSGSGNYYTTALGFPSMSAGASQTYHAAYSVPTSIPLGTSVVFKDSTAYTAPMSNWLSDYSPWNNVDYFTTNVIGSYDPNFKEVSPKGTGPNGNITYADSVLEYMVHFQNTGTYFAENVVVVDTLDDNLDWTTLRPVYMSAPCKVTLDQSGSSKVATFTFSNIHLPAQSMDDLRSNGMFTYTVKTKHGLAVGSQIRNTASIYFDYNAPIKTNGTLNTIATNGIANTPQATYGSFALYPNPANNSFNTVINAEADGNATMLVADITGKMLITKTVALVRGAQTIATDASQLAPGIYLVSLNHDGKTETQKLVIMK